MELRQLTYFQTVSRVGSITKAAEQLNITQPSITVAIQKLEEELGSKLFDRSQRQLLLTVEGKIFLQRVDDILARIQDAVIEMNDYNRLYKGTLRIGIPPMLGALLFPYIMTSFRSRYPHLELITYEEGSLSLRTRLEKGELDIGILSLAAFAEGLETIPITTGQVVVCLPQNHRLTALPEVSFEQLRQEDFVLLQEDTYLRQLIQRECERRHFTPQVAYTSGQIETILGMVEQGAGITFLLAAIARKHTTIVSRPLTDPLYIKAGIAWNKERYLSKAAKAFIDFVKELAF